MSKYHVTFYSSNSKYSYFVKVPNLGYNMDEEYQAIHKAYDDHISKLGVQIDEINCRKIK